MSSIDIFRNDVFKLTSMTEGVNRVPYKPELLGSLNVFKPKPVATRTVYVERKNGTLGLITTSPVGSPLQSRQKDKRDARPFRSFRLAQESTIFAEELQDVREFGQENTMKSMQREVMNRAIELRNDLELTKEHHRLGALQGMLLDADGSKVLYNYFDEFEVAAPIPVEFNFSSPSTEVRNIIKAVVREMYRASKGAMNGAQIHAICGDEFYDNLTSHPSVTQFYLNWLAAQALKEGAGAFGSFTFEGVTFHNYRGTDDNSTVAIGTNECKFFPVGAREMFEVAYSPSEFAPSLGQKGQPMYAMTVPDFERQAYVKVEVYSYPVYLCKRPEILRSGVGI